MVSKVKHNLALKLDLIGFSASALCAIHCALMPFLLIALPLIGFGFVTNPIFEFSFIFVSLIIGTFTFKHGFLNHHKKFYPIGLFITGFLIIVLSHFLLSPHSHEINLNSVSLFSEDNLNWIFAPAGAFLIAVSHFINRKLSKKTQSGKCNC